MPNYEFSSEANAYFNGHDVTVTDRENGGKSIKVQLKDGMWAVEVRDHLIHRDYPRDVRLGIENLSEQTVEALYQCQVEGYWRDAHLIADESETFSNVYSAGRSSGWAALDGTQNWEPDMLLEPTPGGDRERRDEFLKVAFELVALIGERRQMFFEDVREAHQELQLDLLTYSEYVGAEIRTLDGHEMKVQQITVLNGAIRLHGPEVFALADEFKLLRTADGRVAEVECPNCGLAVDPRKPAHSTGCVVGGLLAVIEDRDEFDFATVDDLSVIDTDELWGRFLGPAADQIEQELKGLSADD